MPDHLTFLRLPQVLALVPYSRSHLWRIERQGLFPKRVRLGANRVGWVEAEILDWLSSKLAERGDQ